MSPMPNELSKDELIKAAAEGFRQFLHDQWRAWYPDPSQIIRAAAEAAYRAEFGKMITDEVRKLRRSVPPKFHPPATRQTRNVKIPAASVPR